MKRIVSALLLILMCASLFACTQNGQQDATTTDETTTQTEQTSASTEQETSAPTEETTAEPLPEPEPEPVALFQLAPERDSLMQSYVIKTQNGKLIVIDGGIDGVVAQSPES